MAKKRIKPPEIMGLRVKKLLPFGWFGGKFSHLDWLLPLLPKCHHYCEPFAGSGAVLINRNVSPIETYNDLDGEACNFFRVLREDKEKLIESITLTPFSREEFNISLELDPDTTPLERARRFYVRARQVRTGLAQTATLGRWGNCKEVSRGNMAGNINRWVKGIDQLSDIAERFLRVQIENRPAEIIIELYDSPKTLFYVDPPYIHSTRGDSRSYKYEMIDDKHRALAKILNTVKGMVAISNYDCELMSECYHSPKWTKIVLPEKVIHSSKEDRQEVLWVNYKL